MTSPLADEEELLRLVMEGLTPSRIAERKNVSRQAVAKRLKVLAPKIETMGIEVQNGQGQSRRNWVPWTLGATKWRYHHTMKMLRLLGRSFDGPELTQQEARQLRSFLDRLDDMDELPGGRGVVTFRGQDIGVKIVRRQPWDRGYVRWPESVLDTRPMPPELVMPDEPITEPLELRIWALTDLPLEERHARILKMRAGRTNTKTADTTKKVS